MRNALAGLILLDEGETLDEEQRAAVRAALRAAPASLPALARATGVPLRTLTRIQRGDLEASPAVARALARVLARWGTCCGRAGRRLLITRDN